MINTEKACKMLKNGKIYTEKYENRLESLVYIIRHSFIIANYNNYL